MQIYWLYDVKLFCFLLCQFLVIRRSFQIRGSIKSLSTRKKINEFFADHMTDNADYNE